MQPCPRIPQTSSCPVLAAAHSCACCVELLSRLLDVTWHSGPPPLSACSSQVIGTLEEVHMPQNGINHPGVTALAQAFAVNPLLRVINLNDNTFTEKGAVAMAEVRRVWQSQLRHARQRLAAVFPGKPGLRLAGTALSPACPLGVCPMGPAL